GGAVTMRDRAGRAADRADAALLRLRRAPASERTAQHERRHEHDRRPLPVARKLAARPDVDGSLPREPHGDPPPRRLVATARPLSGARRRTRRDPEADERLAA